MNSILIKCTNVLFLLSYYSMLLAQPSFDWVTTAGGNNHEMCYGVAYDLNGNVYATGQFAGTVNLNTTEGPITLVSNGYNDIYIMAFNPIGEILWAKGFGGTNTDVGKSIATDNDGNIYVTGVIRDTVNFGTSENPLILSAAGGSTATDIFFAKLSSTGNLLWAHNFGSINHDEGQDIKIGSDGNIYLCGFFGTSANFNTSGGVDMIYATNSTADIFMSKFTSDGELIWAIAMGGPEANWATGIATDADNNVFLTGRYTGMIDLDPSPGIHTTVGVNDFFLAKYSPTGQLLWGHFIGSTGVDVATGITVDIEGNVVITGSFQGTVDFDSGSNEVLVTSNSQSDIFLAKYSSIGECLWAFGVGGGGNDVANGVAVDLTGNVYITGFFIVTVDFDPSSNTHNLVSVSGGTADIFVAHYDSHGYFQWAFAAGGLNNCYGNGIAVDNGNKILVGGQFGSTTDFDPSGNDTNTNTQSGIDAFVVQYSSCNSPAQSFEQTICAGDVFEVGKLEFTDPGHYWMFEKNEAGCDSFLSLQLNVFEINSAINVLDSMLIADESNAEYQWYECSATPVLIEGETGQTFSPMQSGNYQVAVSIGGCEEFSNCIPLVITDVKDLSAPKFSVFPNPAKDQFWINYTGETPATALLLNIQGQMVMPPVNLQPGAPFMIQHALAPGLYLLQLNYLEEMRVVKVVVE